MTAVTAERGTEADRRALEAEFPGWEVTVPSFAGPGVDEPLPHWYAQRREPLNGQRPTLGADGPAGLRAALRDFGA